MTDHSWLPNFIIAGAPKAGTSSMHAWIADHPDAFGSVEKETYFMVDPGSHMYRPQAHVAGGLEAWKAQFPIPAGQTPRVILEATPAYIYYQTAVDQIPDLPSQPKCLFMLREPAAQIHSLYTYFRNNWDWIPADMSFAQFVAAARAEQTDFKGNELARFALRYADYLPYLMQWQARLGPDRMKVVTFDQLRADQRGLTKEIAEWVGLDPAFFDTYAFPRENETYVPRNRALQRLNVAIRASLPKGALYTAARGVYRKLNTTKRAAASPNQDQDVLAALRTEFAPKTALLAEAFDLDLSAW